MIRLAFASVVLTLSACSSSSGDGIEPDMAGATTGTDSTGAASTGTSNPGEGGGGSSAESSTQNLASNLAWSMFQGEFDSFDQEPTVEGAEVPPPRRLLGCAVDAPSLGNRVVYVERTLSEDSGSTPDRQLVLVFERVKTEAKTDTFARAEILRPEDPIAWAGRCSAGTTLALLGPLVADDNCFLSITKDEVHNLSIDASDLASACVSPDLDADAIQPALLATRDRIDWSDTLHHEDGTTSHDPEGDTSEYYVAYTMQRRTEMPPVPGEQ